MLVDGEDINQKGANRRALRQRVGLLFQYAEYQLFEETVYKDIAFGPKNQGLTGDELDARVREAFARVHLPEDALQKSPFDLSGGQMRRVALAGVIAMHPRVLVLDEPIKSCGGYQVKAKLGFEISGIVNVLVIEEK